MGWNIEHLAGRTPTRTCGWMDEVMHLVWSATKTSRERGALDLIYRETTQAGGDGHFKLAPKEAAAAASVLRLVAERLSKSRGAGRDHVLQVKQLADAAETAARSRRRWRWS